MSLNYNAEKIFDITINISIHKWRVILPGITISPSPSIENGLTESDVGNKSCKII